MLERTDVQDEAWLVLASHIWRELKILGEYDYLIGKYACLVNSLEA